ncbi:DUF1304 domain-containing protein [Ruania rhizosphaerae]|uniref:DUF1304 domain-containing protein n=1 Tax=Ruania rhizosphaerae TaxID=1840413 RepID=UPI00135A7FC6|nr:DUF1304 domain-containing protein [Ruania rhizosphaerae]
MIIAGLVLTGVAALVHIVIFYLESIAWTGARARAVFGTTEEEARATKALAFNQGFYNLFLAIVVLTGIILFAAGQGAAGAALLFAGAGSMAAASLVLALSSPDKLAAAMKQGILPALGVIVLAIALTA